MRSVSSKLFIRFLDGNEDNIITEEEFVALPSHYLDGMAHDRGADDVWQNERRKEFRQVIDINHDGKVDIEELKVSHSCRMSILNWTQPYCTTDLV